MRMLVSDAFGHKGPETRARSSSGSSALVIGELNVDLIAAGLSGPPQLGKELPARSFAMVLGSASAIFASGLCRLGHQVSFIGKVGDDDFGKFCREQLAGLGVDVSGVRTARGSTTGVTLCLSTQRDRAQVTYPGAIAELTERDIPRQAFQGFSHLHLSCFALQTGLRPAFPRLLRAARQAGLSTSFDPNSSLAGALGRQALRLLPHVDVLFLNEREASELSGERSARAAARALSGQAACTVIKLGSKGALSVRDGKIGQVMGRKVRAVDTTGAGDSFAAGFVSAYLAGASDLACLEAGNACGALSTLGVGGTAAQPNQRQLSRFLKRGRKTRTR
jgi:sugar/nucleoside kinase (ribokinase family)